MKLAKATTAADVVATHVLRAVAKEYGVGIEELRTSQRGRPNSAANIAKRAACYRLKERGLTWPEVADIVHLSREAAMNKAREYVDGQHEPPQAGP